MPTVYQAQKYDSEQTQHSWVHVFLHFLSKNDTEAQEVMELSSISWPSLASYTRFISSHLVYSLSEPT